MNKNLVIIHLESLSESIYRNNEELFSNLNKIRNNSTYYNNYYSSATSTLMTIMDLMFGKFGCCDSSKSLSQIEFNDKGCISVLDHLSSLGYSVRTLYAGFDKNDEKKVRYIDSFYNQHGASFFTDEDEQFKNYVLDTLKEEKFALFVCDVQSHISYTGKRANQTNMGISEQFCERYERIDKTVTYIFSELKNRDILDNTVVVLYGDHGDEFWFRGFNNGYSHAIPPYCDICHTPLIVYEKNVKPSIVSDVISTYDIKDLIMKSLCGDEYKKSEKIVYMRNLFLAQSRRAKVFDKSIAVTDGETCLMLGKRGYRLYNNIIDPGNRKNLLEFFKIKKGKLIYRRLFDLCMSEHYICFMTDKVKEEITERFEQLQNHLIETVESINNNNLRYFGINKIDICKSEHFDFESRRQILLKFVRKKIQGLFNNV